MILYFGQITTSFNNKRLSNIKINFSKTKIITQLNPLAQNRFEK